MALRDHVSLRGRSIGPISGERSSYCRERKRARSEAGLFISPFLSATA